MKISQLINELTDFKEECGDLDVYVNDGDCVKASSNLRFKGYGFVVLE
jgi:hypothetical protein